MISTHTKEVKGNSNAANVDSTILRETLATGMQEIWRRQEGDLRNEMKMRQLFASAKDLRDLARRAMCSSSLQRRVEAV